ncbi:unnamed protein product, partial [Heterotrigona itama]
TLDLACATGCRVSRWVSGIRYWVLGIGYYASEFEARSDALPRKTTFDWPKWKRREQFFERGNYRFVWSPRSQPLQEADRDIGHIPGPNRVVYIQACDFLLVTTPSFQKLWENFKSLVNSPMKQFVKSL